MIEIDKGIPIPELPRRGGRRLYPWHEMEIGDSFWVPLSVRAMASRAAPHRPRRFRCRTEIRDGVQGARVWRVE